MGAGISSLHGRRGLMLDALESVQVVTADGRLVEASKVQQPDLFWAIRGAGSNFGIVTSATYRVYDASNNKQAMNADFVFSANANNSFWQIMKSFDHTLPSQLALTAVAFYDRVNNQVRYLDETRSFQLPTILAGDCSQCTLLRASKRRRAVSVSI